MKTEFPDLLSSMVFAVVCAGKIVRSRKHLKTQNKIGVGNIVTEADLESEKFIVEYLRGSYPDCSFLAEESDKGMTEKAFGGSRLVFVIDPIDGTTNYKYGLPLSAISIGAWSYGLPVAAVVYDVATGDVYSLDGAVRTDPGRENFKLLRKNERLFKEEAEKASAFVTDISHAIVGTDWAIYEAEYDNVAVWKRLQGKIMALRLMGSAVMGLIYAMTGQYTCYLHNSMKPYDVGAVVPMLVFAGLKVTNWKGEPYSIFDPDIFVAPSHLYDEFFELCFGKK